MSKRRAGPTCAGRESELDLGDQAQSPTEPIDIGQEPGRNVGGRPKRADVSGLTDFNERQNERRKRDRAALNEQLDESAEAAHKLFRGNMENRDRREREELRIRKDMARQQRLRGKNGSAPNSYTHLRTGERTPLFSAAHPPSSRKKKKKPESTVEPDESSRGRWRDRGRRVLDLGISAPSVVPHIYWRGRATRPLFDHR